MQFWADSAWLSWALVLLMWRLVVWALVASWRLEELVVLAAQAIFVSSKIHEIQPINESVI